MTRVSERVPSFTSILMMVVGEAVVRTGWDNARILILLELNDEVLSCHLLEVGVVVAAHKKVIMLVPDVLDDEVGRAEGFVADHTDILAPFVDHSRVFDTESVLFRDKDLIFLRVCGLLCWAL